MCGFDKTEELFTWRSPSNIGYLLEKLAGMKRTLMVL